MSFEQHKGNKLPFDQVPAVSEADATFLYLSRHPEVSMSEAARVGHLISEAAATAAGAVASGFVESITINVRVNDTTVIPVSAPGDAK